jgi:hypothetical protein
MPKSSRFSKNMSQLAKFFRLSGEDRRLVLEAAVWLCLARAAVMTLPFRRIASILGRPKGGLVTEDETSALQAHRVAWAVRRTSCYTPWLSNCLAKAIAGRCMLRRRRIASTLYFGMIKGSDGELAAHAWLQSGGITLSGGSNLERYAIVAKFTD